MKKNVQYTGKNITDLSIKEGQEFYSLDFFWEGEKSFPKYFVSLPG